MRKSDVFSDGLADNQRVKLTQTTTAYFAALFILQACVSINVPLNAGLPADPKIVAPPSPFLPIEGADGSSWHNPKTFSILSAFENCEKPELEMKDFIKGFQRKLKNDKLVQLDDSSAVIEGETDNQKLHIYFFARHAHSCKLFLALSQNLKNTNANFDAEHEVFDKYATSFAK